MHVTHFEDTLKIAKVGKRPKRGTKSSNFEASFFDRFWSPGALKMHPGGKGLFLMFFSVGIVDLVVVVVFLLVVVVVVVVVVVACVVVVAAVVVVDVVVVIVVVVVDAFVVAALFL